ncbi:hypothetical protein ACFQS6_02415 [Xanthomonas populi]|uniref:GNAT family N-acetyltransferase n=1 Tax=Xanthomonas populi TaxID=53414 RepID=A0A2S7EUA6_9XANT|nr:hypothetical protein [Xanthomonas populi]PPU96725.1 hypothetical protein XpopCFBP1817_06265 [Xanthomonas populi]
MTLEVDMVPFDGRLNRADFDCGVDELNGWLRHTASQLEKRCICRVFLAIPKAQSLLAWHAAGFTTLQASTILGFYARSAAQLPLEHLPANSGLPRRVPAARMGRPAVDLRVHCLGFGDLLLSNAIVRTAEAGASIGVSGLFVDAKDLKAAAFYQKYGFQPGVDRPLRLWLNLASIVAMLGAP